MYLGFATDDTPILGAEELFQMADIDNALYWSDVVVCSKNRGRTRQQAEDRPHVAYKRPHNHNQGNFEEEGGLGKTREGLGGQLRGRVFDGHAWGFRLLVPQKEKERVLEVKVTFRWQTNKYCKRYIKKGLISLLGFSLEASFSQERLKLLLREKQYLLFRQTTNLSRGISCLPLGKEGRQNPDRPCFRLHRWGGLEKNPSVEASLPGPPSGSRSWHLGLWEAALGLAS